MVSVSLTDTNNSLPTDTQGLFSSSARAASISICIGSECAAVAALLFGGSSHHAYDYLLFCAEACVCTVDTGSGKERMIVESRSTSLPQFVAYS
jgi:hypothetical protein